MAAVPSTEIPIIGVAAPLTSAKPPGAEPFTTPEQFATYRKLVPLLERQDVLFLNSASQPPYNLIVANALNKYTSDALYQPDIKPTWRAAGQELRNLLGRYINADPQDIALTYDTTEAANAFIRSLDLKAGDNIIFIDSEFPHLQYAWMALQEQGVEIRKVLTIPEAERSGQVTSFDAATFAPYVDDRTRAIGLSSIMYHSGQWNDVASICAAYRPKGIHVFVDLTQQVGFAEVDVKAMGVSAAGFGFFKGFISPRGLGAIYVDREAVKEFRAPPVVGRNAVVNIRADMLVAEEEVVYHPDARRFQHENLNYASIAAARAWVEFYLDTMRPAALKAHLYELGDALREAAKSLGIKVVGPESREQHAPHLYILELLDPEWAKFLKSEGVEITQYRLGVRVSFHFYNNIQDVERLRQILEKGLAAGMSK